MFRPNLLSIGACVASVSLASGEALAVVLFDGALGTTPAAQGWVFGASPFLTHTVTQTPDAGFTTLDSFTPRTDKGGYFSVDPVFGILSHPSFPSVLDRSAGFTFRIDLRVDAEAHIARDDNNDGVDDRAGFSVVIVTEDLRAIELGFWEDEIWAYEDDPGGPDEFTHAEGAPLDTTSSSRSYEVSVFGDIYHLLADGDVILAGPLRDYSAFAGSPNVYAIPSFAFFGDDTGSAESRTEIGYVEITNTFFEPCDGDANADGNVDAADISHVIFRLGNSGIPGTVDGDADSSGSVDVADITYVIFRLGQACP